MLNFCSLYSGSSGNSLFVETQNTKLLVDAGVSCKKIENALQDIKVDPSSIDGILITHEHTDHVQGLGTLSRKFDLPVFVNQETLDAMPKQKDKIPDKNIKTFKISDKFEIGDLLIDPFSIPHDAANPCGFNIYKDDKKISIATDIGHMTNNILKSLFMEPEEISTSPDIKELDIVTLYVFYALFSKNEDYVGNIRNVVLRMKLYVGQYSRLWRDYFDYFLQIIDSYQWKKELKINKKKDMILLYDCWANIPGRYRNTLLYVKNKIDDYINQI